MVRSVLVRHVMWCVLVAGCAAPAPPEGGGGLAARAAPAPPAASAVEPAAPGLFQASARAWTWPFDAMVEELERRPAISVVRYRPDQAADATAQCMFQMQAHCALSLDRGFDYYVVLEDQPCAPGGAGVVAGDREVIVGFTDVPRPDIAEEFPEYAWLRGEPQVIAASWWQELLEEARGASSDRTR